MMDSDFHTPIMVAFVNDDETEQLTIFMKS